MKRKSSKTNTSLEYIPVSSEFEEAFLSFLSNNNQRVFLLKGAWGVGKTTAVMNVLSKETKYKAIPISLFGLQSEEMLYEKFVEATNKAARVLKKIKKEDFKTEIGAQIAGFGGNLSVNWSSLIRIFANDRFIDSEELVFIIDDIERKDKAIGLHNIISAIQALNIQKAKVVLICNDREEDILFKDAQDHHATHQDFEKIIDSSFTIRRPAKEVIRTIYNTPSAEDLLEKTDILNLRTYIRHSELLRKNNIEVREETKSLALATLLCIYQIWEKPFSKATLLNYLYGERAQIASLFPGDKNDLQKKASDELENELQGKSEEEKEAVIFSKIARRFLSKTGFNGWEETPLIGLFNKVKRGERLTVEQDQPKEPEHKWKYSGFYLIHTHEPVQQLHGVYQNIRELIRDNSHEISDVLFFLVKLEVFNKTSFFESRPDSQKELADIKKEVIDHIAQTVVEYPEENLLLEVEKEAIFFQDVAGEAIKNLLSAEMKNLEETLEKRTIEMMVNSQLSLGVKVTRLETLLSIMNRFCNSEVFTPAKTFLDRKGLYQVFETLEDELCVYCETTDTSSMVSSFSSFARLANEFLTLKEREMLKKRAGSKSKDEWAQFRINELIVAQLHLS